MKIRKELLTELEAIKELLTELEARKKMIDNQELIIEDLKIELFELKNPPKYKIGDVVANIKIDGIRVVINCFHLGVDYVRMYHGYDYIHDMFVEEDELELRYRAEAIEYRKLNNIS